MQRKMQEHMMSVTDIASALQEEQWFIAFRLADAAMNVVTLGNAYSGAVTNAVGSYLLDVLRRAQGDEERKMIQAIIEYCMAKSAENEGISHARN